MDPVTSSLEWRRVVTSGVNWCTQSCPHVIGVPKMHVNARCKRGLSSATFPEEWAAYLTQLTHYSETTGGWCEQAPLGGNHCSKEAFFNHLLLPSLSHWEWSWLLEQRCSDSFSDLNALADTLCVWEDRRWSEEQWETETGSVNASWPEVTGKLWPEGKTLLQHTHILVLVLSACLVYTEITHTLYSGWQRGGFREATLQKEHSGWSLHVGRQPPCLSVPEQDTSALCTRLTQLTLTAAVYG